MKIAINGQLTEVVPVQVVKSDELFSTYLLDDGTVLRMKNVVLHVYRLSGQTDIHGQPAYSVHAQMMIASDPKGPE